jgi:hypothetical protein
MSNDDDKTGGGKKLEKRGRNKGGDHYDVGYCKPPVEHRWGPGYCPNRRGRPKNIPVIPETGGEIMARILAENIRISDGRKMTYLELSCRSVVKTAVSKGNIKDLKEIVKMIPPKEPPDDGIDHVANVRKKMDAIAERVDEKRKLEKAREREEMRKEIEEQVRKTIEEELKSKTL